MLGKSWQMAHIGLVVKDLDKSVTFLKQMGGKPLGPVKGPPPGIPVQIRFQHVQLGNVDLEIFEQKEGNSPLTDFINKHGEGVHHIAFSVGDMQKELGDIRDHCPGIFEHISQESGHPTLESPDMGGIQIQLV